ncbi:sensor histidine kinase [Nocardioides sambongensis]|uniref:sensor histidine kinase n=1 Tax=Nocardioides sambongensis TaxID=2589074 RepID=UPI00112C59F4|nr:ATP-binding protein [Nocardioides sambongensis]
MALGVALTALVVRNRICRVDPLAAGLVLGLLIGTAHLRLDVGGPSILEHLPPVAGVSFLVVALWGFAAYQAARTTGPLPAWLTRRVIAAMVLLTISRVDVVPNGEPYVEGVLIVTASILGATLLLCATLAGLRNEIQHHEEWLESLGTKVALMEAQQVDQRSRMHEITNTVAGIACASRLIHDQGDLRREDRARLEGMLDREAARLVRILGDDRAAIAATTAAGGTAPAHLPPALGRPRRGAAAQSVPMHSEPAPVDEPVGPTLAVLDLDTVLEPLVCAQQALGRDVVYAPTGLRIHGDADGLAEAFNVLLDNSRKHAPGATTTIEAEETDGIAKIVVSDDGPGVPASIAERGFSWEGRGEESGGQGLGLCLARQRVAASGGRLDLVRGTSGARFVVRLTPAHGPAQRSESPAVAPGPTGALS